MDVKMPRCSPRRTRVLVVGAGPVGLAAAVLLADHGHVPLLVEKRSATSPYPRASTSMRTLEILRAHGLGTRVDAAGWVNYGPMRMVNKTTALGPDEQTADLPPHYLARLATATPVPSRMVSQVALEAILLERLRELGGDVEYDTRLDDLSEDGDGVHARLTRPGGPAEEVVAEYVVAADGAASGVRSLLGIAMSDLQEAGRMITAFYRADLGPLVHRWRSHLCAVRTGTIYAVFHSFDGATRWCTHLMDFPGIPDDGTVPGPERTVALLREALGDPDAEIDLVSVNPWRARLGVADTFRRGRTFLVGDAAHVQTSAGGLGMNTGIQDAHNLAWKLAAVLSGQAAPGLLDTYETERAAAARASLALSRTLFRGYVDEPDGIADLYERCAVDYLRGMMFYRYERGAVIAGSGDAEGDPDVLDPRAVLGCRFPHVWLHDADGRPRSTVDLTGTRWTLLAGAAGEHRVADADACAAELGLDLDAHRVDPVTRGPRTLTDPGDVFAQLAGIDSTGAVLIRPDGVLAWRAPADTATAEVTRQELRGALRQLLLGGSGEGGVS